MLLRYWMQLQQLARSQLQAVSLHLSFHFFRCEAGSANSERHCRELEINQSPSPAPSARSQRLHLKGFSFFFLSFAWLKGLNFGLRIQSVFSESKTIFIDSSESPALDEPHFREFSLNPQNIDIQRIFCLFTSSPLVSCLRSKGLY